MRLPDRCDVLVIGGGPAGSSAATLLARWGHEVVLVDRPPPRPPLAESLPPSTRGLLEAIGVLEAVGRGGFVPSTGNTVWWAGQPRRVEMFPGGRFGLQVERGRFDEMLRAAAIVAGAHAVRPATVLEVVSHDAMHAVRLEQHGTQHVLEASWVLDCTGRSGLLARRWREETVASMRTVALARVLISEAGWSLPDESHTLVESAPWGWGWSVPVDAARRFFTVMFHPGASPIEGDLEGHFMRSLASLQGIGGVAARGRSDGDVVACDASMYAASPVERNGVLAVGDAASFLDPLSSFGMKKALASAWLAGVAVHTALTDPGRREIALGLFSRREREYVEGAAKVLGGLSREAAGEGEGYWSPRSGAGDAPALIDRLRDDHDVRAAFASLRSTPNPVLRSVPTWLVPHATVRDDLVVLEDHLVLGGIEEPVRYLRNIDLVALLGLARDGMDVGTLCASYQERHGGAPLPDILGAVSVLFSRELLRLA